MIVIFKNEEGTFSLRPAYIGFIKNDFIRRSLCILFYPIVILLTMSLNILQVAVIVPYMLLRSVYYPIIKCRRIDKTEIWKRPRTKADKNSRMD
jgi:hypothetical protein